MINIFLYLKAGRRFLSFYILYGYFFASNEKL